MLYVDMATKTVDDIVTQIKELNVSKELTNAQRYVSEYNRLHDERDAILAHKISNWVDILCVEPTDDQLSELPQAAIEHYGVQDLDLLEQYKAIAKKLLQVNITSSDITITKGYKEWADSYFVCYCLKNSEYEYCGELAHINSQIASPWYDHITDHIYEYCQIITHDFDNIDESNWEDTIQFIDDFKCYVWNHILETKDWMNTELVYCKSNTD